MAGPDPAVAAVRLAVRRALTIHDDRGGASGPGDTAMVACSGGADSLALLAATVFEARRAGQRVIGAVVDHGLQEGSAEHTARVVARMAALGADETASVAVTVDPGPAGIEAGAREARYAALGELAARLGASSVLLGHTLDDQAESVLLGLARGSGGSSLQGMRLEFRIAAGGSRFLRPLVGIRRAQTEAACAAEGIEWWEDPHNADPRFTRARVRHTVLPVLERELGPGVAEALARTGHQLRDDMEALDDLALRAYRGATGPDGLDLDRLADEGPAVVTRCLRWAAIEAGAIPSELAYEHVRALARLAPGKEIQLPGHVTAYVAGGLLRFRRTVPGRS